METSSSHPFTPAQERRPSVSPASARPGETVTVEMDRLPPMTAMYIGFGALAGNHQLLGQTSTSQDGILSQTVAVPDWATTDKRHFFFLAFYDQRPFATSHEFHIADEAGVFRVEGEITDEGFGCTAMRSTDDRLYSLSGDTDGLEPGTRVIVNAALTDDPLCQQGLAIEIRGIRTR